MHCRRMIQRLGGVLIGLCLIATTACRCAPAAPRQKSFDDSLFRVTPGVGIGPVNIGMTSEEVRAAIPISPILDMDHAIAYPWTVSAAISDGKVSVVTCGWWCNPREEKWEAETDKIKMANGIGLGTTRERVEEIFGAPDAVHPVSDAGLPTDVTLPATDTCVYRSEGIVFAYLEDRVVHMTVQAPSRSD